MKYTPESIKARYAAGGEMNVIPFWGHTPHPKKVTKACLSQWYDCRFRLFQREYHTAEQFMMARKAALFGDRETLEKIMAAETPGEYKALGRVVRDFDPEKWDAHKYGIVLTGNLAKFSQNPALYAYLDSTGDSVLAEASPYDGIWGVRLGMEDPGIRDPAAWQGQNLLGFALMEARDLLREKAASGWEDAVEWAEEMARLYAGG